MTTNYSANYEKAFDGRPIHVRTWEDGRREYLRSHGLVGFFNEPYVSVTTVLSRVFGEPFPEEARANVEHARERGIEVHRTVALLSGGVKGMTADLASIDPEVAPRVKLIRNWMRERRWRPIYVERAFFSKKYGIAGTPDQVGKFEDTDENFTVLELKPWTASRARLQTAGYSILVRECLELDYVPFRVVLHVKDDRIHETWHKRHARDRNVFLSALNCHGFGIEEGIWK